MEAAFARPSSFAKPGSDACWPDHVAPGGGGPLLDDVSQLNATRVARLVMPLTVDDVCDALEDAHRRGCPVTMRGSSHSMGGHSVVADGVVLDMQFVRHVRFDATAQTVTCGAGALWSSVIATLNAHGKAPRTLQSYCTFSVGGSLSVNAHGITSDESVAQSVVAATVCTLDERGHRAVLHVTHESHPELMRHVLGGYGLFGVVYDVTMRVANNVSVSMETLQMSPADFPFVYQGVLADPAVELKLARIDITNFDWIALYVFKANTPTPTVSDLAIKPREMSPLSRLFFKWLAGPLQEMRFAAERSLGIALDWAPVSDRNSLVYENASPVGRLFSPLLHFDDTVRCGAL